MRKIILYENDHCWCVAEAHIFDNDKLVQVVSINKFYTAGPEYLDVFECTGGSGYGYRAGSLKVRIPLDGVYLESRPWGARTSFNRYQYPDVDYIHVS